MTNGHVLVVDDIPDVGWTIKGLLEDVGYFVIYTSNSHDALVLLASKPIDTAILDVRLDETVEDNQDGILLMREINKDYPLVKIIIFTGYAALDTVYKALLPNQNGVRPAFAFLQKNEFDKLTDVVKSAFL